MQKVFRHLATGDLYVLENGALGTHQPPMGLDGTSYRILTQPHTLVSALSGDVAPKYMGDYEALRPTHSFELVVSSTQFDRDFEHAPEWIHVRNTPIDQLVAEYEAECCDFSDLDWVAQVSMRYASTLHDSQVRCLLYAMARARLTPQVSS